MALPPTVPVASSSSRPRIWVGVVLVIAGIVVVAVATITSLMLTLAEGDSGSSNTPSTVFISGAAIGGVAVVAGIALSISASIRRRSRRSLT